MGGVTLTLPDRNCDRRGLSALQRTMVAGIVTGIAAAAFAFGAVYPWGYWPVAGIASAIAAGALLTHRKRLPVSVAVTLASVAAIVAVQLVPLQPRRLDTVSPRARSVLAQTDASAAIAAAAAAQPVPTWTFDVNRPLSLDPHATRLALALFAALGTLFVVLAGTLTRHEARRLGEAITGAGVALAMVGLSCSAFFANGKVYGFWQPISTAFAQPFGPFVNRNHFAGWMLMAVPLATGVVAGRLATGWRETDGTWRGRMLWFGTALASHAVLAGFGVIAMAVSLVFTFSRSGLLALTCAGIAVTVLARPRRDDTRVVRSQKLGGPALLVSACAAALWIGVDRVARRWLEPHPLQDRFGVWRDTLRMWGDFPVLGVGLNAFERVYPAYQSVSLDAHYSAAHNDYLQLLAEGGAILAAAIIVAIVAFIGTFRARLHASGSISDYWLRIGAACGLAAVAFQELGEFSLQIPANAALFAIVAAIAIHPPDQRRSSVALSRESPPARLVQRATR